MGFKEEDKSIQNIFSVDDTDLINKDKISNYKIHIMTINALLGNSGDEVLFKAKRDFHIYRETFHLL